MKKTVLSSLIISLFFLLYMTSLVYAQERKGAEYDHSLKLYYDFEDEPALFEFTEYKNSYKLILDKSGHGNEGHLTPFFEGGEGAPWAIFPQLTKDGFKGKGLQFIDDYSGTLSVVPKDLIVPGEEFSIVFYFKLLPKVIKYPGRRSDKYNEILFFGDLHRPMLPGIFRITIDENCNLKTKFSAYWMYRGTNGPVNIISDNSNLINKNGWNSVIIIDGKEIILNGIMIAKYAQPLKYDEVTLAFAPSSTVIDEIKFYNRILNKTEIENMSLKPPPK